MTGADKAARYDAIVAVLKDGDEWRELKSCADAVEAISVIIDEPPVEDHCRVTVKADETTYTYHWPAGTTAANVRAYHPQARNSDIDIAPVLARWEGQSAAFRAEHPWCGWTVAFAHGSDWDTTCFGLERMVGINILLTTADGRSRPVSIIEWQRIDPAYEADPSRDCERKAGVFVRELDTDQYEPLDPTGGELVPYEDIREIVVF